jgi:peroxiredoxin family protein
VSGNVVLFVSSASYSSAWESMSIGLTAVAMGDRVVFVFAFDALVALARGAFGHPETEAERMAAERGEALGAALPDAMLADARRLGAKAVACDTTVKLCGLSPEALRQSVLDEVLGLPEIWRQAQGARVLHF